MAGSLGSQIISKRLLLLLSLLGSIAWSNLASSSTSLTPLLANNNNLSEAEYSAFVDGAVMAHSIATPEQEVIAPLIVDGRSLGVVHAIIADDFATSNIDIAILIELLEPFISVGLLRELKDQLGLSNRLNFIKLQDLGILLNFDADKVLLQADLAPRIRKRLRHNLHTHPLQQEADPLLIPNAQFNGGLDYILSGGWLNEERQPFNLELDGHLNLDGWVLQNRHSYRENKLNRWQRRQTLLTYDSPDQLTRFSAGDLNYPRAGFMGNPQLSGISFGTFFELQPQLVNYPQSDKDFFLEQDSRVEVFIDGQLSGSRDLIAGQHNIYDMPLIDGVNQVELRITDILGRQQTLRFFETQDQRLLTPGLSNYSITIGVPRVIGLDGIEYQDGNQQLSAFYRHGLSEDLTLGGWLELDNNVRGLGITGVSSQVFGAFSGEIAISSDNRAQNGVSPAIRLGYRYRTRRWSIDSEWYWQDKNFSTLSQTADSNNPHHQARISITFPHLGQWTANLSLSHSRRWQENNQFSKRLTMTRQFARDFRFSVNFAHFNSQSDQESFISMQFYWSPSRSRHIVNASYNSIKQTASTEYSYRRDAELGLDFRAGLRNNNRLNQQRVDINYLSSKMDSRLTLNYDSPIAGVTKRAKNFSLGSAVAFADGQWATSRPLRRQPFALFTSKPSIASARIGIVRGAGTEPSTFLEGADDTAIMPNLSAYYVNQLNLDLQDLPIEMQIQKEHFRVKPSYRSAVVVQLGAEGMTYITATLLDHHGQPIIHKVAYIHSLSNAEPIMLFTDENGFTAVEGLEAGNYQIQVPGIIELTATFKVPEGKQGALSLGQLVLREGSK
jgi:outer membrane usher protein